MRTTGTFNEILTSVRSLLSDNHRKPYDCVIRILLPSGKCIMESRLEPENRNHICIDFNDFVSYWYDLLMSNGECIESDIADYKNLLMESASSES